MFVMVVRPCAHTHHQAAKRRAITELLFFASVGDLRRCQRIVRLWNLDVRKGGGCEGCVACVVNHGFFPHRFRIPHVPTMTSAHHCTFDGCLLICA